MAPPQLLEAKPLGWNDDDSDPNVGPPQQLPDVVQGYDLQRVVKPYGDIRYVLGGFDVDPSTVRPSQTRLQKLAATLTLDAIRGALTADLLKYPGQPRDAHGHFSFGKLDDILGSLTGEGKPYEKYKVTGSKVHHTSKGTITKTNVQLWQHGAKSPHLMQVHVHKPFGAEQEHHITYHGSPKAMDQMQKALAKNGFTTSGTTTTEAHQHGVWTAAPAEKPSALEDMGLTHPETAPTYVPGMHALPGTYAHVNGNGKKITVKPGGEVVSHQTSATYAPDSAMGEMFHKSILEPNSPWKLESSHHTPPIGEPEVAPTPNPQTGLSESKIWEKLTPAGGHHVIQINPDGSGHVKAGGPGFEPPTDVTKPPGTYDAADVHFWSTKATGYHEGTPASFQEPPKSVDPQTGLSEPKTWVTATGSITIEPDGSGTVTSGYDGSPAHFGPGMYDQEDVAHFDEKYGSSGTSGGSSGGGSSYVYVNPQTGLSESKTWTHLTSGATMTINPDGSGKHVTHGQGHGYPAGHFDAISVAEYNSSPVWSSVGSLGESPKPPSSKITPDAKAYMLQDGSVTTVNPDGSGKIEHIDGTTEWKKKGELDPFELNYSATHSGLYKPVAIGTPPDQMLQGGLSPNQYANKLVDHLQAQGIALSPVELDALKNSVATSPEWGKEQFQSYGLSNAAQTALKQYTSSSVDINQQLRFGTGVPAGTPARDKAMQPVPHPAIFVRGTGWNSYVKQGEDNPYASWGEPPSKFHKVDQHLEGKIVEDKGYHSTSAGMRSAFGGPVVEVIHVPPGVKGTYIDPISTFPGEREFLMARGTKFRIISVKDKAEAVADGDPYALAAGSIPQKIIHLIALPPTVDTGQKAADIQYVG